MLQRCSTITVHFATNLPPDSPSRLCDIHDVLSTRVLEVDTLPPGLLAPKNSRSRISRVAHGSCHSRERVRCRQRCHFLFRSDAYSGSASQCTWIAPRYCDLRGSHVTGSLYFL